VGEDNVLRLATHLEEDGSGIIIWDKFWATVSRLMSGASLASVLEVTVVPAPSGNAQDGSGGEEKRFVAEMERHDQSFDLYYYNGLREGKLIKFSVTKLSAEDAVGASVALTGGGGGGGSGGNALEEVCRTRFVSARFDWGGQAVPSID
jgi:hypothetical protein